MKDENTEMKIIRSINKSTKLLGKICKTHKRKLETNKEIEEFYRKYNSQKMYTNIKGIIGKFENELCTLIK